MPATLGRPTKFTKVRAEAILDSLRNGNTRTASAEAAGINRETLRLWCRDNPSFLGEVEKAEADAELGMVKVVKGATEEAWTAAAWWLERRRHEDWAKRETVRQEHSGDPDRPIKLAYVNDWRPTPQSEPGPGHD